MHEIDLHGLAPEAALRRLGQELHAARVRGLGQVLVITGRGLGNKKQKPVLRGYVEAWLDGPDGRRLGVGGYERRHAGGALEVRL
jgi:DNA-nicking Smr family endonuclease